MPDARPSSGPRRETEWPTILLVALTYFLWFLLTRFAEPIGLWIAIPALAVVIAQHSSLQHEIIHGHPFRNQRLSDALVFPAIGLAVPARDAGVRGPQIDGPAAHAAFLAGFGADCTGFARGWARALRGDAGCRRAGRSG